MTEPSPECRAALRSGPVGGSGWADRVKVTCASSSARKIHEPASRIRRAFAGSALILPLLLLPTVPSPAVRPVAIFIERVAVIEEYEAFMARVDWLGVNAGS